MKQYYQYSIKLFLLSILVYRCTNPYQIDTNKLIANYEIDKFIIANTKVPYNKAIENSIGWSISLKKENQFTFKGTNKVVNGYWLVNNKKGNDYYITIIYENKEVNARINGTIIYFDRPNQLLDSLFRNVIFVKTTRTIE